MTQSKEYKTNLPEISLKYKTGEQKNIQIKCSRDIFELAKTLLNTDTVELQEEFLVIYVNRANRTLGWTRASFGGITYSVADPRLIFSTALIAGATGLVCVHNHPSGNLKPSVSDMKLTEQINQAGKFLEIYLIDHLIIAGDLEGYFSFADEGHIY